MLYTSHLKLWEDLKLLLWIKIGDFTILPDTREILDLILSWQAVISSIRLPNKLSSSAIVFRNECYNNRHLFSSILTIYDTFQDWRTLLIPKQSKLKLSPSYLFFISSALNTFKMSWIRNCYTKYWLEVQFSPILRYFFLKNIIFSHSFWIWFFY